MEKYPKLYLYQRIVQAKLFMDQNYAERIDVYNVADAASFSRFHFIRLFKKIYEKTPYQYLTAVRIEAAKQLLMTNQSVSSVCFAVGFESLSSFSGLFKRITGLTPSAFLLAHQKTRALILKTPLSFVPGCILYQYDRA